MSQPSPTFEKNPINIWVKSYFTSSKYPNQFDFVYYSMQQLIVNINNDAENNKGVFTLAEINSYKKIFNDLLTTRLINNIADGTIEGYSVLYMGIEDKTKTFYKYDNYETKLLLKLKNNKSINFTLGTFVSDLNTKLLLNDSYNPIFYRRRTINKSLTPKGKSLIKELMISFLVNPKNGGFPPIQIFQLYADLYNYIKNSLSKNNISLTIFGILMQLITLSAINGEPGGGFNIFSSFISDSSDDGGGGGMFSFWNNIFVDLEPVPTSEEIQQTNEAVESAKKSVNAQRENNTKSSDNSTKSTGSEGSGSKGSGSEGSGSEGAGSEGAGSEGSKSPTNKVQENQDKYIEKLNEIINKHIDFKQQIHFMDSLFVNINVVEVGLSLTTVMNYQFGNGPTQSYSGNNSNSFNGSNSPIYDSNNLSANNGSFLPPLINDIGFSLGFGGGLVPALNIRIVIKKILSLLKDLGIIQNNSNNQGNASNI